MTDMDLRDAPPTDTASGPGSATLTARLPSLPQTASALAALTLAACGGGGGADDSPAPDALDANGDTSSRQSALASGKPAATRTDAVTRAVVRENLPGSGGAIPAVSKAASVQDATRFLTQATFGPASQAEVYALYNKGYERWLWEEFNKSVALHTSFLDLARVSRGDGLPTNAMSYAAIWQQWLNPASPGEGQLRARVAFALSQILVVSNQAFNIPPYGMSSYMDLLNRHAFGNFRTLLEEVTLHPAMGWFLNLAQSRKGDPAAGTHPNENYAREVLQLFSIGLVQLNPDGSPKLVNGKPIPTYNESVVKGFAAALTGWGLGGKGNGDPKAFLEVDTRIQSHWTTPMLPFPAQHSPGPKLLLNGVTIPAGGTPQSDLRAALDNIFQHPNVGPFIGRQLIQRLVTSNPSPGYVMRVAAVFDRNERGERGDLRAVIRAILLDAEARDPNAAFNPSFGKLREPVIRLAHLLRAMGAKSANGMVGLGAVDSTEHAVGQSPLLAPSVFNFFSPNFRPAGPLAAAGLAAPEFQVTSEPAIVGLLNFFASVINSKKAHDYMTPASWALTLDYTQLAALAADPPRLIERLNLLFFCQQMSVTTKNRMLALLRALPDGQPERRVKNALFLTVMAPDFVVQK